MKLESAILALLLSALLSGCQNARHEAQPAPLPQDVSTGSTLAIVKGFIIPSGDSSVYFQDARLYPKGEIQSNYPFCEFMAGAASAAGDRLIPPAVLTVSNVDYNEQDVGPGGMSVSVTKLSFQETASGGAYSMDCMLPLLSDEARFVTPVEIQGALGDYMNLKVAP
jgi:hypothetical protein